MENLEALLDALLELQEIDEEIKELENLCRSIPVEIEERRKRLVMIGESCEVEEARLKDLKVRESRIELDINAIKEEIERYEQQQMEAKSNVAYQVLKREIREAEKRIDGLMEEGLPLIDEIESAEKKLEEMKEEYQGVEKEFKADESDLLGRKGEAENKLQKLRKVRAAALVRIPEDLGYRYQRIRDSKDGLAVVPLEGNVCSGCFGQIPIQKVNEIRHENELRSCENCGRIIYYRENTNEGQGD